MNTNKTKLMLLPLVVTAMVSLSLTGCKTSKSEHPSEQPEKAPAAAEQPSEHPTEHPTS